MNKEVEQNFIELLNTENSKIGGTMCPICKSREIKVTYITHSYYLREIKAGTEVFKTCQNCGYGWYV